MQLTRRFTNHASDLFTEFDRLFRHPVGRPASGELPREFSLYETDQSWILRTDLPGFKKEDLSVQVTDGILTLEGSNKDDHSAAEVKQSLRLPKGVQTDRVTARLEHGVLELVLPKSETQSPESLRIEIN
ncbi:MAG: Hsp20/alpha crystallin family protein [Verrucomicrobia bacterium]|nr:Hsp20/alpha crystallin family protein [Verrucomicrobiota bacterium]